MIRNFGNNRLSGFLSLVLSAVVIFIAGCSLGPKYKRPIVNVPDTYRGLTAEESAKTESISFGDQKWSEVFQDEQLQELIRTAFQQNYDVRIAASRVLQSRAQLGITRADQFPTLIGEASATNQRTPTSGPVPTIETSPSQVKLALSWEADFWGKFRRATEAARADLLASEWARQAVITSLVADVTSAYFRLRELDLELEISKRTLLSRQESLRLVKLQEQHGATSMLEVRQAEQLVFTAAGTIPDLERRIEQQENFISILLGENLAAVRRGWKLTEQPHAPEVPPGLPSFLLERRPDIRLVEKKLIAANARIGVAKAAYFPRIALTATGGYQSSALSSLFSGPAGLWNFVGALTQPLFAGARIRSGVRLAEARQQAALLVYQQTIQQAFREVSDSLVAYRKNREFRIQQELLTQSAQDAARLSDLRYRGGATSYLEVLDSNTRYFSAELGLAQAQLNELLALVQLYRSLGGGWRQ